MSDIKALEYPTLKVPYEILNKKFRAAQKNLDREVSHVTATTADLEKGLGQQESTVGDIKALLGSVVEKLHLLKRKADESVTEEMEAAMVCKRRLEHLKQAEGKEVGEDWSKKRIDRMLVEHFLRAGYYDTALKLADKCKIRDLTNIEVFLVSKEVEDALTNKDISKCLAWCYDNKSKLRKLRSSLEFNLRQQEFVELIRKGQKLEAVKHARKHFTTMEEDQMRDIQRAMMLLALPLNTQISPYKELFEENRWKKLVEQFRYENYRLYQLNYMSVFSVTLQAGLSSLKTPQCYRLLFYRQDSGNPDCPVCCKHLNVLAQSLPYAHCAQSRLICNISGSPLNEHNVPLMLPNGYVYGELSLKNMAALAKGKVTCPRTGDVFDLSQCEKVFVM